MLIVRTFNLWEGFIFPPLYLSMMVKNLILKIISGTNSLHIAYLDLRNIKEWGLEVLADFSIHDILVLFMKKWF